MMSSPAPESRIVERKRTRLSLVWVVPIVAALVGVWVTAVRILGQGPKIEIVLRSAEGLEAGKTKLRHNGVDVGELVALRLSDDHARVIATAQMAPETKGFLVEDTSFWVVRPRISGANVTGLGTLISGAYIGMEIGHAKKARREFEALTEPPVVKSDDPGRYFVLNSADLGSLEIGTPLFFRRLHVGQVVSYELAKDGQSFWVRVFVNAPYDQYVTHDTRFWHASGFDVSLSASGLSVQTQSVLSILIGGVAFETPPSDTERSPAEVDARFKLFASRVAAYKPEAQDPQIYVLEFRESLRGLSVGAPVEFRGIPIGEVVAIDARIDARTFDFVAPVTVQLDPARLGVDLGGLPEGGSREALRRTLVDNLVAHGARAQLQSGNLLTGARFIAFDFFAGAPPVKIDWSQSPAELPTLPGRLEALEARVVNIIKKLDEIPFKGIGDDLRKTIGELDRTLVSARGTLDKTGDMVGPTSPLNAQLENTLQELARAAQALRVLADYLERHPEALIRGKAGEAK
jgi:paraquat-inducible protein B